MGGCCCQLWQLELQTMVREDYHYPPPRLRFTSSLATPASSSATPPTPPTTPRPAPSSPTPPSASSCSSTASPATPTRPPRSPGMKIVDTKIFFSQAQKYYRLQVQGRQGGAGRRDAGADGCRRRLPRDPGNTELWLVRARQYWAVIGQSKAILSCDWSEWGTEAILSCDWCPRCWGWTAALPWPRWRTGRGSRARSPTPPSAATTSPGTTPSMSDVGDRYAETISWWIPSKVTQ